MASVLGCVTETNRISLTVTLVLSAELLLNPDFPMQSFIVIGGGGMRQGLSLGFIFIF